MITLHYAGSALTDDECEEVYKEIKDLIKRDIDEDFHYQSENLFNRIRVGICEDEIPHEEIQFEVFTNLLHPNEYGRLDTWPNGFCDYNIRLCERLLTGAFAKRKRLHPRPNEINQNLPSSIE